MKFSSGSSLAPPPDLCWNTLSFDAGRMRFDDAFRRKGRDGSCGRVLPQAADGMRFDNAKEEGAMPRRSEFRLTKRAVDALETGRRDALFWDRDLAGFGVRVHATGRKAWVAQSRGPRGVKRVTLGRHGEMTCEEARRETALVIDRIKRGEDPVPKPPEEEPTVAVLAERFMRTYVERRLKPGTVAEYRTMLEKYILPALGGTALFGVGRAQISAFHHGMRGMPSRANTCLLYTSPSPRDGLLSRMPSSA